MSYYDTIDEDIRRAKEILTRGQTVFSDEPLPDEANFGGAIYGGDNYAAYKLLESFVAEIARLRGEHTRDILRYTTKGYQAGENADAKAWRERAEEAEQREANHAARLVELHAEIETVRREKRQQFAQLLAIRTLADEATGTDRSKGDPRESGALGAVKLVIARLAAEQEVTTHHTVYVDELRAEIARLQRVLHHEGIEHSECQTALITAQAEIARLRDIVASHEEELGDLQAKYIPAVNELGALRHALNTCEIHASLDGIRERTACAVCLTEALTEIERLQDTIKANLVSIERLCEEAVEQSAKISDLRAEVEDLHEDVANADDATVAAQEQALLLREQLIEAERALERAQGR